MLLLGWVVFDALTEVEVAQPALAAPVIPPLAPLPVAPLPSETAPPATESAVPGPESPCTGRPARTGAPVLAVKIDNVAQARPHTGLEHADIVYVEPVEAGLTRLIAVFCSGAPEVVGPVRSVRETDLELLAQFGRPALAFSGGAPELLPLVDRAPLVRLSPAQAAAGYFRSSDRQMPHNLYARPAVLTASSGAGPVPDLGWRFGDPPEGGVPTPGRSVRYERAEVAARWSPEEARWLVSMDGAPLVTTARSRVGAATVIIQRVPVRSSPYSDVLGYNSPFAGTVGAGEALVLRDGQAFQAKWSRSSPSAATAFSRPSGELMTFARGPVWIVLAPA